MLKYIRPVAETIGFELEGNAMNSISDGSGIATPSGRRLIEEEEEW